MRGSKNNVIWLLVVVALYLVLLCVTALVSLHPFRTPLFISPGALGATQEELEIPSSGGIKLKAWWVPAEGATTVAILCHGYVMNRSELTPVAHWLWERGISSMLIDFRAHGHTRGGICTIGYREADDVSAAVAEALKRSPGAKVLLIGSSMGSAAIAFAASNGTPADAIVLDSCYSTLLSASFGWWRFLGGRPLSWLLGPTVLFAGPFARINPFRVNVGHALKKTKCPVMILHGRCDNLALPSEAEENLNALGNRGSIVWFDDCGHSEFRWIQFEQYYRALESFLIEQSLIQSASLRDVAQV